MLRKSLKAEKETFSSGGMIIIMQTSQTENLYTVTKKNRMRTREMMG